MYMRTSRWCGGIALPVERGNVRVAGHPDPRRAGDAIVGSDAPCRDGAWGVGRR